MCFSCCSPQYYQSFMWNQEGMIELQKKVHRRICMRNIFFLATRPSTYVIFSRFVRLLSPFFLFQFYVETSFQHLWWNEYQKIVFSLLFSVYFFKIISRSVESYGVVFYDTIFFSKRSAFYSFKSLYLQIIQALWICIFKWPNKHFLWREISIWKIFSI